MCCDAPQTAVHSRTSPESISPDSLEVDTGHGHLLCDQSGELLKAEPNDAMQIDRSTSPLPVTFSSSSAQTEWQWDLELQSLQRQFKVLLEKNRTQEKDFKLTEAQLHTELSDSRECLQNAESRIQETEAQLREREVVVENLRGQLEEVTACMKVIRQTESLGLLQESQNWERRSFRNHHDQSEQRSNDLEEHSRQKEMVLQKVSAGETLDDLLRRCQELQNQLDESDSEVSRLQARLQTEETLYYDLEHDYERTCEEIQSLQGALLDYERNSEERFQTQLIQHQQELQKKESELQELLVKLATLGSSLEEAELKLRRAQTQPSEANEMLAEPQHCRQKELGAELAAQAGDSHRVISVIQALEQKLCDTEARLQELTVHVQHQQHLNAAPCKLNNCRFIHSSPENPEGQLFHNESFCSPSKNPVGILFSLEAKVLERIVKVFEHPRLHFLNKFSEIHAEVLRIGRYHEPGYSQIFMDSFAHDPLDAALSEGAIENLCVRAEIAYLLHSLHSSKEKQQSDSFSENCSTNIKIANGSMQRSKLADITPSELASYSNQMEEVDVGSHLNGTEAQLPCRKSLVAELQSQVQSLQNFSTKLRNEMSPGEMPSEVPADLLRAVMNQATLAYVACRLRSALQQKMTALCKQKEEAEFECLSMYQSMEATLQEQAKRYEQELSNERNAAAMIEQELVSAQTNAQRRTEEVERLQMEFEEKLQDLQKIHEKEMSCLHEYHKQNLSKAQAASDQSVETEQDVTALHNRIRELETKLTEDLSKKDVSQLDLETIKSTYEHGFCIMEESHQRVIEDMQRQHQREVERLKEDKERVLQEETNATIAEEQEQLQRELEVLSEQYSQKCLENIHLTRTIVTEREAMSSTLRENLQLRNHNQELNDCLNSELSLMHSRSNGEVKQSPSTEEKDVYQLEVNLRVKEYEIKCLKQEISSLKLELQAENKSFKDSEMTIPEFNHQTLSESSVSARKHSVTSDVRDSRTTPDVLKEHSEPIRHKCPKDGLTVMERMKLFE
ncbi:hypothetical protein DNTS_035243 [Danionella cerebrum]|nr:hypothetical protein DNTS_035243 [Danionella translucida]